MSRTKKEITEDWKKKNREKWESQDPFFIIKEKKCSLCKEIKASNEFAKNISELTGLQAWCNKCRHEKHVKDPRKQMLVNAKSRAKLHKLDFNLSLKDIIIPKICPVLGIPIEVTKGQTYNSPSLDRLIPSKGYVKNNVQVISWRANDLKKNATIEELEKVLQYLKEIYENKAY